jgi:hypothetical protein
MSIYDEHDATNVLSELRRRATAVQLADWTFRKSMSAEVTIRPNDAAKKLEYEARIAWRLALDLSEYALRERDFDIALAFFLAGAQELVSGYDERHIHPDLLASERSTLTVSPGGQTYLRVYKQRGDREGGSLYCFIQRSTGNIYKGKGWKAPDTKIIRGNIFSEFFGLEGVDHYGARYAR